MARQSPLPVALLLALATACGSDISPSEVVAPIIGDPLFARAAAKTTTTAVTSTLHGDAANPLSIQSDQGGAYRNGVGGVVSILQSVGDWELDLTGRKSARTIQVDLREPAPGTTGAAPFAIALVKARIIAKGTQLAAGSFAGMHGLGSTIQSPLSITFAYGGADYAIRMNRSNHATTEYATVTCTAVSDPNAPATSPCTAWSVLPSGVHDGVAKNVGRLERVGSSGNVHLGDYLFTFSFALAR